VNKLTALGAALAMVGSMSAAHATVTTYDVTQTFNQVVYNTTNPDWDTWFYGSFSYDDVTHTVSGLMGKINQAMDGAPGSASSAWVYLTNQLSSIAVDTNGDSINDGLVVSVFKENTTNVFKDGIYGTGGFGPNGAMGPVTTYGNQNAFVSVFVNLADPTAGLTTSQLDYIAYGDCTPAALMPRTGSGTKCMAGWNGYDASGNLIPGGTMKGTLPNMQTITAAVPEPETYAMMMAGLSLVGFMSRRRRRAV
jgi:hypothetical protein